MTTPIDPQSCDDGQPTEWAGYLSKLLAGDPEFAERFMAAYGSESTSLTDWATSHFGVYEEAGARFLKEEFLVSTYPVWKLLPPEDAEGLKEWLLTLHIDPPNTAPSGEWGPAECKADHVQGSEENAFGLDCYDPSLDWTMTYFDEVPED
ncbi:hypothetical protein AB0N09_33425, partial [Streptomyces erythrochromogenes]|uniref:hypothetical protein n=1 Tax=Streptomyces erythrochromogenes TaxID=285574 RepID=UPI00342D4607